MNSAEVLQRLRRFLLVLTIALFAGALIELWLVGHTEDVIQWIPFVLATAGSLVTLVALFHPSRAAVNVLRVCMVVVALGTILGIYLHMEGNIAFEREVDPAVSTSQAISRGLSGGNPLLAPGVLAVAAVLALAATYRYDITGGDDRRQVEETAQPHV
jgi:hypothetical protein